MADPTPARIEWEWTAGGGPAATRFEVTIGTSAPVNVGLPSPQGAIYGTLLPAVSGLGLQGVIVRAYNAATLLGSAVARVVKV